MAQELSKKKRYKWFSHKLSKILRHEIHEMDHENGYVPIEKILHKIDLTEDELKYIVTKSIKKRFDLIEKNDVLFIRANQGHTTIVIDDYEELDKNFDDIVIHATYKNVIESILETGLKPMRRIYVHMCGYKNKDILTRKDSNVYIHIDIKKAMNDGIKFCIAKNDVILTKSILDKKYFSKIEYL